ncbi:unnamed protein product, partial [Brassica rapa subsp. narinosa]
CWTSCSCSTYCETLAEGEYLPLLSLLLLTKQRRL